MPTPTNVATATAETMATPEPPPTDGEDMLSLSVSQFPEWPGSPKQFGYLVKLARDAGFDDSIIRTRVGSYETKDEVSEAIDKLKALNEAEDDIPDPAPPASKWKAVFDRYANAGGTGTLLRRYIEREYGESLGEEETIEDLTMPVITRFERMTLDPEALAVLLSEVES